ncbi:MAG: hypothetical protein U1F83_05735 [Verrucomicrobiota bacterium]
MSLMRLGMALPVCALLFVAHERTHAVAEGLAANFPGDVGIEKNPAVLFAENFESGIRKKRISTAVAW